MGAIAVLATLVYLARQISHNTTHHKLESARAVSEEFNRLNSIFFDLEKFGMMMRALAKWDTATVEEQTITFTFLMQYCQHMQALFDMWNEQMVTTQIYLAEEETLLSALANGGGAQWWEISAFMYSKDFADRINAQIASHNYPSWAQSLPHMDPEKWPRNPS